MENWTRVASEENSSDEVKEGVSEAMADADHTALNNSTSADGEMAAEEPETGHEGLQLHHRM
jgi:hypothetical protein